MGVTIQEISDIINQQVNQPHIVELREKHEKALDIFYEKFNSTLPKLRDRYSFESENLTRTSEQVKAKNNLKELLSKVSFYRYLEGIGFGHKSEYRYIDSSLQMTPQQEIIFDFDNRVIKPLEEIAGVSSFENFGWKTTCDNSLVTMQEVNNTYQAIA